MPIVVIRFEGRFYEDIVSEHRRVMQEHYCFCAQRTGGACHKLLSAYNN